MQRYAGGRVSRLDARVMWELRVYGEGEGNRVAERHIQSNAEVAVQPPVLPPRGSYAFDLTIKRSAERASVTAALLVSAVVEATLTAEQRVTVGASEDPRVRVRVSRFLGLHEYSCAICLKPMTRTQVSVLIPCFHRFCYACIFTWFKRQLTAAVLKRVRPAPPACVLCRTAADCLVYLIKNDGQYCALAVREWFAAGAVHASRRFRRAGIDALAGANILLVPDASVEPKEDDHDGDDDEGNSSAEGR